MRSVDTGGLLRSFATMPNDPSIPSSVATSSKRSAASVLAGVKIPFVHADNDDAIQVALVG